MSKQVGEPELFLTLVCQRVSLKCGVACAVRNFSWKCELGHKAKRLNLGSMKPEGWQPPRTSTRGSSHALQFRSTGW